MAVYKTYSASTEYANAAVVAAEYLESTGIFDSVSIDDSTITCTYNEEVVATIQYTAGRIDVTFGAYTFYAANMGTIWVGKTGSTVLLDHTNPYVQSGGVIYSIVFCKTQSGKPMLIYHEQSTQSTSNGSWYSLVYDSLAAPTAITSYSTENNLIYSNLCGLCTTNVSSESVASADKVFRFVERQTNVPKNCICIITIGGVKFMTDGYIAVSDE